MADGYFHQLGKLLRIVDCLAKPQGAGIKELQEALECNDRTVYRWIDTIESLGFPVEELSDRGYKRYRLIDSYVEKLPNISIPDFNMSFSDIILLHVILSQDRVSRGTQLENRMENLLKRLSTSLPVKEQKLIEAVRGLAISNPRPQKDYSQKEDIIQRLTEAILGKKRCSVLYHSFHKKKNTWFPIHPLHFFESQGGLYVMVQLAEMKEPAESVVDTIRVLAVERIRELILTKETFAYPEGLDPHELLSRAFDVVWNEPIEVKVWFSESAAPYVKERVWPGHYEFEENDDGSLVMHLKTSGYGDVKRWILSFGNDARVLEPLKLRDDIAETCRKMAEGYAKKDDDSSARSESAAPSLRSRTRQQRGGRQAESANRGGAGTGLAMHDALNP